MINLQKEQKQLKIPKCKNCGEQFERIRTTQVACSPPCAMAISRRIGDKKTFLVLQSQRKEVREAKAKLKTRKAWLKEAQAAFNAWIRHRDKELPCVSCGSHDRKSWDAGHFRTTAAAPELRFNELNVHRQCVQCNQHQHGNLLEFRIGLIKRIGVEKVEWLEGKHDPAKHSIDDLKAIKQEYHSRNKLFSVR